MNHRQFRNRIEVYFSFFCILVVLGSAPLSAGERTDSYISEAYQLRMNGKADLAKALLKQHLKTDSTNALAWFELARTKNHIFNSKPDLSQSEWNEILDDASKAVKLNPKNETFAFYYSFCKFLDAFLSLMQGQDAGSKITAATESFQSVVDINPDCMPAMLYQMDIYGMLPEEMGGDRQKAKAIAEQIKSHDKICYEMAKARLLSDTTDFSAFWLDAEKKIGTNAQVLEEIGRGFLFKSDAEKGEQYYLEAIKSDPSKSYLRMNLARYFLMKAEDPSARDNCLRKAEELVNLYIQSSPEPLTSLKAHAYSILAMISSIRGDQTGSAKYSEIAAGIDPFCSKATGMPPEIIYCPPDKVKITYTSLFLPF